MIIMLLIVVVSVLNIGSTITQQNLLTFRTATTTLLVVSNGLIYSFFPLSHSNSILEIAFSIITICIILVTHRKNMLLTYLVGLALFVLLFIGYIILLNSMSLPILSSQALLPVFFLFVNIITLILRIVINKKAQNKNIKQFWQTHTNLFLCIFSIFLVAIPITSTTIHNSIKSLGFSTVGLVMLLFFALTMLVSTIVITRYQHAIEQEQTRFHVEQVKDLNNYVNSIRASRHDYNSHINTINQLVKLRQYNELEAYLRSLIIDNASINAIASLKYPELSALLFNHQVIAKENNINLNIYYNSNLSTLPIDLYDLSRLLNNLMSNAIEAASNSQDRKVTVHFSFDEKQFNIQVLNSGSIPDKLQTNILKPGITSKVNKTEHGYGMYIIDKITSTYNGTLTITVPNTDMVMIQVELPIK
ncbi:sensor histidine kinase [Periweissella cryptocerci]|nr:GHKL domain-containing protein [Periweissella cryptocerci]